MKGYSLVSVKQLIAELYSDFNISNDDFVEKVNRHAARALGIMQIRAAYTRKYSKVTVVNRMASVPCDNQMVLGVVLPNCNFSRLPITNSNSLGNSFKDLPLHSIYKGTFDAGWLITNFDNEEIVFIYHAYPKDKDGYLLIPNEELLLEALPYFIIYKLSLGGYQHPIITLDRAEAKWKELYPQARNLVNKMTPEEYDRFVRMRVNPLFIDILNEDWQIDLHNINELDTSTFIEELNRLYPANL